MNFDQQAKTFDINRRKKRAEIIANRITQYINNNYLSAMEFGCGTGLIGLELVDKFSDITFIDSSKGMIEEVNKKISGIGYAKAIQIDLMKENLLRKKFDCIFTSMVLHHIKNTNEILTVLNSMLNDNGSLIIVDLDKNDGQFHISEPDFDGHDGFEHTQIFSLLTQANFDEIEIQSFYQSSKEINGSSVPYSLFIAKAVKPALH